MRRRFSARSGSGKIVGMDSPTDVDSWVAIDRALRDAFAEFGDGGGLHLEFSMYNDDWSIDFDNSLPRPKFIDHGGAFLDGATMHFESARERFDGRKQSLLKISYQ
jgi:hypothetical protein